MHEGDRHAAFAHAAGNPLYGVVADVANTENARKIGFQQKRGAICCPTSKIGNLTSGADVAALSEELRRQLVGCCVGTDHDKECVREVLPYGISSFSCTDRLQVICPIRRGDNGFRLNVNIWDENDLIDQVLRHGELEIRTAEKHGYRACIVCEKESRLASRVSSTDNEHTFSCHRQRLRTRRSV